VAILILNVPHSHYDNAAVRISAFLIHVFVSCFISSSVVLLTTSAYAQRKRPRSEDYPVAKRDMFKGKPLRVLLDSKRARWYRSVLRDGANSGPNFAGHYTIVTWGAGLGGFSMAVVDAKTGKVYFPPFKDVGNTGYGILKINNPAWWINSKLFAFVGIPDANNRGMGMYVYLFSLRRFRLIYFVRENEEKTKSSIEWQPLKPG
jgi:hypothetical protein